MNTTQVVLRFAVAVALLSALAHADPVPTAPEPAVPRAQIDGRLALGGGLDTGFVLMQVDASYRILAERDNNADRGAIRAVRTRTERHCVLRTLRAGDQVVQSRPRRQPAGPLPSHDGSAPSVTGNFVNFGYGSVTHRNCSKQIR
jgi:hypothetical protein